MHDDSMNGATQGETNREMDGETYLQKRRRQELELIERVASSTKTAVVTGPAAARWMGLHTFNWVDNVDLLLPGSAKAWTPRDHHADRTYRSGRLNPVNVHEVRGIRVTTLNQCCYDSYRYWGRREALVQLESARNLAADLTVDRLLRSVEHLPRGKGIGEFRELIRHAAATSESPLETIARDAILRAAASGELPEVHTVECQVRFLIRDRYGRVVAARVDLLINGYLVVELDGRIKSDGTFGDPQQLTLEERLREKELQNLGLIVLRYGWDPVLSGAFLGQIRRVLAVHPAPVSLPERAA